MWFLLSTLALAGDPVERVNIELSCGSVEVSAGEFSVVGDAEVTRSGRVRIRDRSPQACVDLSVTMPRGARLSFESISGSMKVAGLSGRVDFRSVSGDLEIAKNKHSPVHVEAHSVSGDLDLHVGKGAEVDAESVSGRIGICGGPVSAIDASAMSGRIAVAVKTTAESRIEAEAHGGPLVVQLDRAPGRLHVETFAGKIENQLTEDAPQRGVVGSQLMVDHDRGPSVELETFAGKIRLQSLTEECP